MPLAMKFTFMRIEQYFFIQIYPHLSILGGGGKTVG